MNLEKIVESGLALKSCDRRRGLYLWVNRITNKKYVGIASGNRGYYRRVRDEISYYHNNINKGTPALFGAFKKYKIENFDCFIICEFDGTPEEWCGAEKSMIKLFDTKNNGYNITDGGSGTLGTVTKESTREKLRISLRGKSGRKPNQFYKFIDPNGNLIRVTHLTRFCSERGLNLSHMHSVYIGREGFTSHKGYTSGLVKKQSHIERMTKGYALLSPEGDLYKGVNRKKFALENGLCQAAVNKLCLGEQKVHKGWVAVNG